MAAKDVILVGALIFTFGLGFFIIHFVMGNVVTNIISVPEINSSQDAVDAFTSINTLSNKLDYVFLALFTGLIIGLIVTAWFIGGHPVFMAIYFLVIVIAVILSVILSNVWFDVTDMVLFGTTLSHFTIMNHILLKLPIYIAVTGIIGMIAMFAKPAIMGGNE